MDLDMLTTQPFTDYGDCPANGVLAEGSKLNPQIKGSSHLSLAAGTVLTRGWTIS